jgi:hypothetical protein
MNRRLIRYSLLAAIPAIVIALGLIVWFVPGGPKLGREPTELGVSQAHVGDYYTAWDLIGPFKPIVVKDIRVDVEGQGCHGRVRLVRARTFHSEYISGVSRTLPGTTVVGHRITFETGGRIAVVLYSTGTGQCVATKVHVATQSWGRERWTTTPVAFSINVTQPSGQDPRVHEGPPQPL